jgi:hypothetical protein
METAFNDQEMQFVRQLQDWVRTRKAAVSFLFTLLLVCGGLVIVTSAVLTLAHLSDRTAYWVTVPGFLIGILFIGLYIVGDRWVKERSLIASVLKKAGLGLDKE